MVAPRNQPPQKPAESQQGGAQAPGPQQASAPAGALRQMQALMQEAIRPTGPGGAAQRARAPGAAERVRRVGPRPLRLRPLHFQLFIYG